VLETEVLGKTATAAFRKRYWW